MDYTETFHIKTECDMLAEVQDIIEELQIIQQLDYLQQETMRQFEQNQHRFQKHALDLKYNQSRQKERGTMLDRPSTKTRERNVNRLLGDAKDLKADIRQQLRLKQQQVSVAEAACTRRLYEQGAKQGDSVMLVSQSPFVCTNTSDKDKTVLNCHHHFCKYRFG